MMSIVKFKNSFTMPMSDPCTKAEAINYIKERVDRIDSKVDSLLEFKWKVVGISIAVGTVVGVAIKIVSAI
jgi:hypothetical protein